MFVEFFLTIYTRFLKIIFSYISWQADSTSFVSYFNLLLTVSVFCTVWTLFV